MNKLIKSLVFCFPLLLTACGSDESTTVESGTHSSSNNGTHSSSNNGTHSSSNNGTHSSSNNGTHSSSNHGTISIEDTTITLNQGGSHSSDLNTTGTKDLRWSIKNKSKHGSATLTQSGRLTYEPRSDFSGTDTITVSVTDDVNTATAIITFKVIQKVKTFISISDTTKALNQGESYTANLNTAGIKGLKWSIVEQSIHGTVTLTASGKFVYKPKPKFYGSDKVTVSVTDDVNSDTATFTFVVNKRENTAPVIEGKTEFSSSWQTINNQIIANDKEGDKLNFYIEDTFVKPSYIEFSIEPSGKFTYKNTLNYSRTVIIPIVVSDGVNSTATDITFITYQGSTNTFISISDTTKALNQGESYTA
ncbi:Ig-like domain-containing protein, partial [Moritella sp. JT01]|uniref:Ig-like domain-containing protein n=1 Tax=Moritella sp. JT01 TaxID=756698 RepID=UPI0018DDB690